MVGLSRVLPIIFFRAIGPQPPSWKQLFFKERNLKKLGHKFKKCSEYYRFRCKQRIYEATVTRLTSAKRFSLIEDILEEQKYDNFSNEGFAIRIIKLYGRAGMFKQALKTFDQLPDLNCHRTVKFFNALLNARIDSSKFDEAEKIFRHVPSTVVGYARRVFIQYHDWRVL